MIFPFEIISSSEKETENLAAEFAPHILHGDVILLNGNLGSGKTFFAKALCSQFGIDNVSSPSFAIVNEYKGRIKFAHFDFYRIKKSRELLDIGFYDYLNNETIVLIEWAELYPEVIPNNCYEIKLEYLNETQRKIKIEKHG